MPPSALAHGCRTALSVLCCLSLLASLLRAADSSAARTFDIAAGDALATLKQFSTQAESRILYSVDAVQGVTTNSVKGSFTPKAALERMVAGTALGVAHDEKTGALGIQRQAPPPLAEKKRPTGGRGRGDRAPPAKQ